MILAVIVLGIIEALLGGWMLMLLLGVVHAHVLAEVNPVGFGTAFLLSVLVSAYNTGRNIFSKVTED